MLRYAFLILLAVGALGIGRVLIGASSDRAGDAWMRWTPSVDLASLAPGEERVLAWNGRDWIVRALPAADVAALATDDARATRNRLLRVELGLETRWFAVTAAPAGCEPGSSRAGSVHCGDRYDAIGRSRDAAFPDLATPDYVIREGRLHLHPDQRRR